MGLTNLNEAVKMIKKEEIEAFLPRSYMPKQILYFWVAHSHDGADPGRG